MTEKKISKKLIMNNYTIYQTSHLTFDFLSIKETLGILMIKQMFIIHMI